MPARKPGRETLSFGVVRGEWWHRLDDGQVQCDVCPRACTLRDGEAGFCSVRAAQDGQIVLTSYGRATGHCIDPIEQKPLHHFYPGSSVLSFGTAGCNLGCRYCGAWDGAKAQADRARSASATPAVLAEAAVEHGCTSIAFTYNDPIVFAEYAIDCAIEAHARGVKTVAVSSGYMAPAARRDFYAHIDAANIDLKAFSEDFYHRTCAGHLAPVLDTLRWLARETPVWLEVTTPLVAGHNDSPDELARLCGWFVDNLGPEVPLHFIAVRPDAKMLDVPPAPPATLRRARTQALAAGLKHVYAGNVFDSAGQSTACAGCGQVVIGRDGARITAWRLDDHGRCTACQRSLAGHVGPPPLGHARRLPVMSAPGADAPAADRRAPP